LSISEYEEMTPSELNIFVDAFHERAEREQEDKVTLVWLGEYFHRVEKLPSLNEVLGKKDEGMTDDQMLENVRKLNAMFGGTTVVKGEDE
jgi:hypothetical protein